MKNLNARHQDGAIFLALVLVLFVTGSTFILGALNNRDRSYLAQQRELHEQMENAKANLLAYLANSDVFFGGTATEQGPGFFPCPDTDDPVTNEDGLANYPCSAGNTAHPSCLGNTNRPAPIIGRLPKYIEEGGHRVLIGDDGGDPHARFWYVVAPRYVYHPSNLGARRARLRTSMVTSLTPAPSCMRLYLDDNPDYVAFIIAPGEELPTQNRSGNPLLYSNYLDGLNGGTSYYFYSSYESNPSAFNDQIIGITLEEYVKAVGRRVAIESQKEIDAYYEKPGFGYYPVTQSAFRSELNDTVAPTDRVWLLPNTTGYNGERWSTDTFYTRLTPQSARIYFSGCTGITFTLTYPDKIEAAGESCL